MFFTRKATKRKKIYAAEPTKVELELVAAGLWQFGLLPTTWQHSLVRWCRVFIAEKTFEGCRGFDVTQEMKWAIAASCALCVPLDEQWFFDRTESILLYPDPYIAEVRPGIHSSFTIAGQFARAGETIYRGPVILNWRDVQAAAAGPNHGNSLTIHEFAHQLDLINGPQADGLPPLAANIDQPKWVADMRTELTYAQSMVANGHRVYINDYGLSSPSEFFAVASEYYFQTPHELSHFHPGVFRRLFEFYRVDLRDVITP